VAEDELERRVHKLALEHLETRWLALRLDEDVKEVHEELRVMDTRQLEHTARFDSIDAQMRSLTQLVGEAIEKADDANEKVDGLVQTVAGHTSRLDSVDSRLDSVDSRLHSLHQMMGEVLRRLPEPEGGQSAPVSS
jgi:uncharacterized coiled-coil DUF342 family protein